MTAKLQPQDDSGSSPSAIRAYLTRLLSDPAFPASARRRKLLEYVVEQTLAGRANRLKAFDLAVAVLGRDERFDPQNDPIVRIEVGRLRRDLEHYYADSGSRDPIRIAIPKGHYVPTFEIGGPARRAGRAPPLGATPPTARAGSSARSPCCASSCWARPSGIGRMDQPARRCSGRGRPSWCCRFGRSGAARATSSWRAASPPI